jgi:hypothetical protein
MTVLIARPSPPDLQALVAKWGGYRNIPSEAWAGYDLAMLRWRAMMSDPAGKPRHSDPAKGPRTFAGPSSASRD